MALKTYKIMGAEGATIDVLGQVFTVHVALTSAGGSKVAQKLFYVDHGVVCTVHDLISGGRVAKFFIFNNSREALTSAAKKEVECTLARYGADQWHKIIKAAQLKPLN